jgi:G:T-mismatch repair DNA endonuclease (very short patch repair protein)
MGATSYISSNLHLVYHRVEGILMIFDGFEPKTKTVFEFNGDYWHGNPQTHYVGVNQHNGRPFEELYQATLRREEILRRNGFTVISIWESEWRKLLRNQCQIERKNLLLHAA